MHVRVCVCTNSFDGMTVTGVTNGISYHEPQPITVTNYSNTDNSPQAMFALTMAHTT